MMARPLADVRVLDLGTFISAPFCGTLLAEFGADVLKVELPSKGDSLRTLGEQKQQLGLLWLQEARNKQGITCDLRQPEGQAILRDLVASGYDVILENFRPGTLERWNLGYEQLRAVNPGVILARISGYGQDGPAATKPGFGRIAQAFGGLTYLCGFPDRPPANPGSATIADYLAGLFTAFGVMVAREHRAAHGNGQVIDVSLYESVFRILDSLTITYGATGKIRERCGTATPLAAPHNHYPTADGRWVAIACTNDRIFGRLAHAMGWPELADDPRFAHERLRVANREAIDELVSEWTSGLSRDELLGRLDAAEVPCSPINSIADAFEDPQFAARGTIMALDHEELGTLRMPAVVPRLSATPGLVHSFGPALGQHTDHVLRERLGYSPERLRSLRERGIV
jgi:crotonobetainyl-CoA:carnitine CoA-transferase CaiB-like acyl-CoA transferase